MLHTHQSAAVSLSADQVVRAFETPVRQPPCAPDDLLRRKRRWEVPKPEPLLLLRDDLNPVASVELLQPDLIDAGMRLVGQDTTELHHPVSPHINAVVPAAKTAHAEVITQAVEVPLC